GGAAGVWYASPDTLEQLRTSSPGYTKPPAPLPAATPLQKATEAFAQGNYEVAAKMLDGKAGPAELSAHGAALWLPHVKEQAEKKQPPDPENDKVKQARKELEQANKDHPLLQQMDQALAAGKLQTEVAQLQASDKAFREVREVLEKAMAADPGAKPED